MTRRKVESDGKDITIAGSTHDYRSPIKGLKAASEAGAEVPKTRIVFFGEFNGGALIVLYGTIGTRSHAITDISGLGRSFTLTNPRSGTAVALWQALPKRDAYDKYKDF